MRIALGFLLTAAAIAQVAKPVAMATTPVGVPCVNGPKVAPQSFTNLEARFDGGLAQEGTDILGFTRALYLRDYGLTLTAEVDLLPTPGGPFRREIKPEDKASVHARKMIQVPRVEKAMREMIHAAALTLGGAVGIDNIDNSGLQVVLAVKLKYRDWEDTTNLPAQITMKADLKHAVAGDIQEEVQ